MKKLLTILVLPAIVLLYVVFICIFSSTEHTANAYLSISELSQRMAGQEDHSQITAEGKININTASESTLTLLTGIGDVLAERIIAYRELNGPFNNVESLLDVKGIGPAKLKAIIDFIAVE